MMVYDGDDDDDDDDDDDIDSDDRGHDQGDAAILMLAYSK